METIDNNVNSNDGVTIDSQITGYLKETAKWANFLAIVGFIVVGLMLLGSLFLLGAGAAMGGRIGLPAFTSVLYLGMTALYFFPTYYLYLFSKKIKIGLNSQSQSEVNIAFENLKKMFKFMGIFMIVILAFYVLALLFGIGAGVASGF